MKIIDCEEWNTNIYLVSLDVFLKYLFENHGSYMTLIYLIRVVLIGKLCKFYDNFDNTK